MQIKTAIPWKRITVSAFMPFHGLVVKEVVGKTIHKHRDAVLETMCRVSGKAKKARRSSLPYTRIKTKGRKE